MPAPRTDNPDFLPSLKLLIESEKYSLTDVGMMFGVTRERARQWCVQYGVSPHEDRYRRGLRARRIWDDTLNRFRPVPLGEISRQHQQQRVAANRTRLARSRELRRLHLIATATRLATALGRMPTLTEIAEACLGRPIKRNSSGGVLMSLWDTTNKRPTREKWADMKAAFKTVGLEIRGKGRRGHVQ